VVVTDLYETLGVDRAASTADIKRAYRSRAKNAHPDAGGDPAEFRSLCMALAVLKDPARREKYDRTGNADAEPDTTEAEALNRIAGALEALVMGPSNPNAYDLVGELTRQFKAAIGQGKQQRAETIKKAEKWDKLADRFTRKGEGDNLLASIAKGKAVEARRIVESCDQELAKLETCIAILAEHGFEVETPPRTAYGFQHGQIGGNPVFSTPPQERGMW
jgi:DnaJ-class molecular chaperone